MDSIQLHPKIDRCRLTWIEHTKIKIKIVPIDSPIVVDFPLEK